MSDDLQQNLEQYRTQLQQVEAALLAEPDSDELIKLKTDLDEVIALTVDLIGGNDDDASTSQSEGKQQQQRSEQRDSNKEAPNKPAGGERALKWKGDKCLALSSKNNAYYEAVIDEIVADSAFVTFTAQGTTEICKLSSLRSSQTMIDMTDHKKMFYSHKSVMAKKMAKQADRERRQKRQAKKAERLQKMEESREADKNKWKAFNSKAETKGFKGVKKNAKSIFATPEGPYGKVGVSQGGKPGEEKRPVDRRQDMMFYGKGMDSLF